jgi:hypothetical protein
VAAEPTTLSYEAKIKHDGKLHEFTIHNLPIDQWGACGETYFTNLTADAKSQALQEYLSPRP